MDRRIALPLLLSTLPLSTLAATVTANLTVKARVVPACVVTGGDIDFGVYDGAAKTIPATISVTCNDGVAYQVALDAGLNSGTAGDRQLVNAAGDAIPYTLNYGGTTIAWGDSGAGDTFPAGEPLAATGTGAEEALAVDGMVAAAVAAPPGDYTDTVTITVNF